MADPETMLTVACVLKSGGIYNPAWVARLKAGVKKHLPLEHRFICLSDVVGVPAERVPLKHDWPGWWSKMELFRLSGPVLFFDLDTLIVGDLTSLAIQAQAPEFTMLRDFYREKGLASGVMAWNAPVRHLYDGFKAAAAETIAADREDGDQGFIERHVDLRGVARWQDRLPGQIVSYKAQNCAASAPAGARVMCLHGKPKFDDMPAESWARQAWERAA